MRIKRISAVLTAVCFSAVLLLFCALTFLLPKATVSESERRKLAEMPALSVAALLDGSWFSGMSDYLTDHFALRESWRTVNSLVRTEVLLQSDVNGVFEESGYLFEPIQSLDERAVTQAGEKLQKIMDTWFAEKPVYVAIIPDKADFAEQDLLKIDTGRVVELITKNLDANYIDISSTLELSDYYRTDTHWRQECLGDTAAALITGMGGAYQQPDFSWNAVEDFYGVLWGRYAMPLFGETLLYGTNEATENAVVKYLDHPGYSTVYVPKTDSPDKYDLFLSGAASVIEIENPEAETDEHLVLFRDSFGSSLAPWLLTYYEKITMIDIRYISSEKIGEYTALETADAVLFLYSTAILNTGGILK